MIETVITTLCTIILLTGEASAQNVIKRGQHPFAAFIYYTDETINDVSGERFLQSAVLIKLEWLVSASIDSLIVGDTVVGFPEKTLVARVGAITIDNKITLNEDEDEQEREVVQVVRPYGHVAEKAVFSDITLLKTLLPFTSTPAVGLANMNILPTVSDKSCSIIVFNQKTSDERNLIEITVDMKKSKEQCGPEFTEGLMACGYDSEESKTVIDENHYCHGNAGGPLICEGEVAGIQSYINQICRQPHLFNLFSGWNNFINCGTEQKCKDISCQNVCVSVYKDDAKSITESIEITSYLHELNDPSEINNITSESESAATSTLAVTDESTSLATEETSSTSTTETSTEESTTSATEATNSTTEEQTSTTEETTSTTEATTSTTEDTTSTTEATTSTTEATTSTTEATTSTPEATTSTTKATTTTTESTPTSTTTEPTTTTVPKRLSNKLRATHKENVETTTTKSPDLVRKPKIEAQSDTKNEDPEVSRRQNEMNSSSTRYVNGLLIIFLNLVVAI